MLNKGYEVEWVTEFGKEGQDDDFDPIADVKYGTKNFKTHEAAMKFAEEIIKTDECIFHECRVIPWEEQYYEPGRPGKFVEYLNDGEWIG